MASLLNTGSHSNHEEFGAMNIEPDGHLGFHQPNPNQVQDFAGHPAQAAATQVFQQPAQQSGLAPGQQPLAYQQLGLVPGQVPAANPAYNPAVVPNAAAPVPGAMPVAAVPRAPAAVPAAPAPIVPAAPAPIVPVAAPVVPAAAAPAVEAPIAPADGAPAAQGQPIIVAGSSVDNLEINEGELTLEIDPFCSYEEEVCRDCTEYIKFGIDGKFVISRVSEVAYEENRVDCTTDTFKFDPNPGYFKECYCTNKSSEV